MAYTSQENDEMRKICCNIGESMVNKYNMLRYFKLQTGRLYYLLCISLIMNQPITLFRIFICQAYNS